MFCVCVHYSYTCTITTTNHIEAHISGYEYVSKVFYLVFTQYVDELLFNLELRKIEKPDLQCECVVNRVLE